jgi:hypothetical protein
MSTSDDDGEQATAARPGPSGDQRIEAFGDAFGAGRDMRLDQSSGQNVSGQRVEVHFHQGLVPGAAAPAGGAGFPRDGPPGGQAGRDPAAEADGHRGHRRRRPWLLAAAIIGVVGALVIGLLVRSGGSAPSPGPQPSLTTVQLLGNDVLFSDPRVEQKLRQLGFVVTQTLPDSRTICGDVKAIADYDISDTSSQSASCYENLAQKAGKASNVYNPYEGLMVIVTYTPIVKLLEQLHVASEVNGITIFNVARYLKVFHSGKRWIDIKGNTVYPSDSQILLWTTNPKESNLGGMLADIAYAAQNGGNSPISIRRDDPYLGVITSLFTELGDLPNFSVLLLNQFLAGGMGEYPMAMVYESQYLSSVLTGIATDPNLTFMYPTPDVSSEDALVAWTPAGKKLIAALQSKPMTTLMEDEGYRTVRDKGGFVAYMTRKGLHVPNLDDLEKAGVQFSTVPTDQVLTELINVVAASQPR